MPNWKTHIEIAKRLNEYFKYSEEELELFMFGSVLPDINNSYIVTDISKKIGHDTTHMGKFINPSYINFYNKYKNEIDNKNPLFLGYLAHLYTDYKWNNNFYTSIQKLNIQKDNRDELRIMKQSDFKVYNNKFIKNIIEIKNIDMLLNEVRKISEVSIEKEDVLKIMEFLHVQKEYDEKLKFYSGKELDELMNCTVKELLKIKN